MNKKILSFMFVGIFILSLCTTAFAVVEKNEDDFINENNNLVSVESYSDYSTNGFQYPGATKVYLSKSFKTIKYFGSAPKDGVVILRITKTDGSDWQSFTIPCNGTWREMHLESALPSGMYNISLVRATTTNYTCFVNFA